MTITSCTSTCYSCCSAVYSNEIPYHAVYPVEFLRKVAPSVPELGLSFFGMSSTNALMERGSGSVSDAHYPIECPVALPLVEEPRFLRSLVTF